MPKATLRVLMGHKNVKPNQMLLTAKRSMKDLDWKMNISIDSISSISQPQRFVVFREVIVQCTAKV